jgi:hypothetical protein
VIIAAGITFAVLVLALIISLLLRRQLGEKYATLWLIIGLGILILALFPGLLVGLSRLLGVEVPSNLIFAFAIALLVGVALHLSWELSRAEDEVRRVAEDVAILKADVEDLQRALRDADGGLGSRRDLPGSRDTDESGPTHSEHTDGRAGL